jgi:hypothetical protein
MSPNLQNLKRDQRLQYAIFQINASLKKQDPFQIFLQELRHQQLEQTYQYCNRDLILSRFLIGFLKLTIFCSV